jgi:hypothetical protein
MLLVISQFNCLPGSSEEGWELGCTIKMTSAYKLMFGILGEHYLANSHFYFYFGGGGADFLQTACLSINVFPN